MTTINHESETVSLGYWKVMIVRDEDDHLSLFISNEDGSEVFATGADTSERACWGERFTTKAIEKRVWSERYRETIEK